MVDFADEEEGYDTLLEQGKIKDIWDCQSVRSALDKAHIIPKALGGELIPKNLFCLCHRCHRNSPDTRFPQEFFKWIYQERKQPFAKRVTYKAIKQCLDEGISPDFKSSNVNMSNMNTHGGLVVESSVVATMVGCAKERNQKFSDGWKLALSALEKDISA